MAVPLWSHRIARRYLSRGVTKRDHPADHVSLVELLQQNRLCPQTLAGELTLCLLR
jgi:hypothetical protein